MSIANHASSNLVRLAFVLLCAIALVILLSAGRSARNLEEEQRDAFINARDRRTQPTRGNGTSAPQPAAAGVAPQLFVNDSTEAPQELGLPSPNSSSSSPEEGAGMNQSIPTLDTMNTTNETVALNSTEATDDTATLPTATASETPEPTSALLLPVVTPVPEPRPSMPSDYLRARGPQSDEPGSKTSLGNQPDEEVLKAIANVSISELPPVTTAERLVELVGKLDEIPLTSEYPGRTNISRLLPLEAPDVVVVNPGTVCEFRVDNTKSAPNDVSSPSDPAVCGGVTATPAALIPSATKDPLLECTRIAQQTYVRAYWDGGYLPFRAEIETDLATRSMQVRQTLPVLRIFRDFGCFSAYRAPDDTLVGVYWYMRSGAWPQASLPRMVALTAANLSVVDVSSTVFTYRVHREGNGKIEVLPAVERAVNTARRALFQQDYVSVSGDVAVFTFTVVGGYPGLAFAEFLAAATRFWVSGVFDKPNVTLVMPLTNDKTIHGMRAWLIPYLPVSRVLWLMPDELVRAERSWFVPVVMYDDGEPCRQPFMARYLLARLLRTLRADSSFDYGDGNMRRNPNATDVEWAKTLPKKVAIIKSTGNKKRRFIVGNDALRLFAKLGFAYVSDLSPMLHRTVLVNFAEVVVTTHGSLQSIVMNMWGGGGPGFREGEKLRIISLLNPGYNNEREWWFKGGVRVGEQDGRTVGISDRGSATASNVWTKGIVTGEYVLDRALTPKLLSFTAEDCTLDPANATDFPSEFLPWFRDTNKEHRHAWLRDSWKFVPRVGRQCSFMNDLAPLGTDE